MEAALCDYLDVVQAHRRTLFTKTQNDIENIL